jgi:photosystem II stability/assembly factor-like uncharacterized protein
MAIMRNCPTNLHGHCQGRRRLLKDERQQGAGSKRFAYAVSTDGGTTFDQIREHPDLVTPVCQGSLLGYKDMVLFAGPYSEVSRTNLSVLASYDNGQTFSKSLILDPGKAGYTGLQCGLPEPLDCAILYDDGSSESDLRLVFRRFASTALKSDDSLHFEPPVLVGTNFFTKWWFPNTAARLSSGKVLLSISQGLDGYPCPPLTPAVSSRADMIDLLPKCAAELASNCSQMYVTEDNGSSWHACGRNFSIGNGNHWVMPGAELDSMTTMAGCEKGAGPGPWSAFKCDKSDYHLQRGVLARATVSANLLLEPTSVVGTPEFNGKALSFPNGFATKGSHELVTLVSVVVNNSAQLCCQSSTARCGCQSLLLVSSTDYGANWRYQSRIDTVDGMSRVDQGIDESDLELLQDGCILVASRIASPARIWTAKTCDAGKTWQQQPAGGKVGAWSVYPRLLRLANNAVVMSSGRPGLGFWVNFKGDGDSWKYTSVPRVHNELTNDTELHYRPEFADIATFSSNSHLGNRSGDWQFGASCCQATGCE